jgi:hypothetical protein
MTRSSKTWFVAAALGLVAAGVGHAQLYPKSNQTTIAAPELQPDQVADGLRRVQPPYEPIAAPHGKSQYRNLLRQFEVAADRASYGDFYDYGYWAGGSYAGQTDLPAGYWVYLAPNWYIFKDDASASATAQSPRNWGPEQATGAPDTWPRSGDLGTAWASKTQDGQREWLDLTYDAPVKAAAVTIYETFNPGAVDRVTGYDASGKEVELWAGADPTPAGQDKGISVIPIRANFELSRIRIYLDSPKVPGWNEIDAVGLLDDAGTTHWAKSATASSSYADVNGGPVQDFGVDRLETLRSSGPAR